MVLVTPFRLKNVSQDKKARESKNQKNLPIRRQTVGQKGIGMQTACSFIEQIWVCSYEPSWPGPLTVHMNAVLKCIESICEVKIPAKAE